MTAEQLVASSDEFSSFLAFWERERYCPHALVDWLLDRGEDDLAGAARWASEIPQRTVYPPERPADLPRWEAYFSPDENRYAAAHLFPAMAARPGWWTWRLSTIDDAAHVPRGVLKAYGSHHDTVRGALVWVLDRYVAATRYHTIPGRE